MSSQHRHDPQEGSGLAVPSPETPAKEPLAKDLASTAAAVADAGVDEAVQEGDVTSTSRRRAKRRPCFQCGALTPVPVLEKTGELCWQCYRPVGYLIVKNLLVVAVVLGAIAGTLVGWRYYVNPREASPEVPTVGTEGEEAAPRQFTTEEKLSLLRRHFLDRELMSELCAEYRISPTEFRRWREQFFEAGEVSFQRNEEHEPNAVERRIGVIEQKLQMAAKVLGELRDNLGQLKKESGQYEISPTQRFILESGPPPK